MSKKVSYESDLSLGERVRDTQTGYEGVVTSITFFQYACERVCVEDYDTERKAVRTEVFDAPRLVKVSTGERARVVKTGGPGAPAPQFNPSR